MKALLLLLLLGTALAGDAVSPTAKLAQAEAAREQGPFEVATASFPVEVPTAVDPRVTCWVARATKDGKPAPRSQTAIALFHTPGAKELGGALTDFARTSGFTVFGCLFPSSGAHSYYDRQRFYGFAASGSFASTAKAFAMLRAGNQLRPRLFAFGYSAGGIMSQRFAEEYPELMLGVASICGHTFVQKKGATCPFLIMHTLGDYGVAQGDNLARYYVSQGVPVIRAIMDTNWELRRQDNDHATHAFAGAANQITLRYFEGIEDLRQAAGGESAPPPATWPLVCSSADPRLVAKNTPAAIAAIAKAGATPIVLPSARTHQAIIDMPPAPRRSTVGAHTWVVAPTAPDVRPTGIWLSLEMVLADSLLGDAAEQEAHDDTLLQGDLRCAASQGLLAIGARVGTADYRALVKDALTASGEAAVLPIHLQLINPTPDTILRVGQIPRLSSLTIVFTGTLEPAAWAKSLATIAASRLPCRVCLAAGTAPPVPPALGLRPEWVQVLTAEGRTWDSSMRLHQLAVDAALGLIRDGSP